MLKKIVMNQSKRKFLKQVEKIKILKTKHKIVLKIIIKLKMRMIMSLCREQKRIINKTHLAVEPKHFKIHLV